MSSNPDNSIAELEKLRKKRFIIKISLVSGLVFTFLGFGLIVFEMVFRGEGNSEFIATVESPEPSETSSPSSGHTTSTEFQHTTTPSTATTRRDLSHFGEECKQKYSSCIIENCEVEYTFGTDLCHITCFRFGSVEGDFEIIAEIIEDLLNISVSANELYLNCLVISHSRTARCMS